LSEVAHEALLRKWPLLRGWLDEEREFLIGKDQLEQDLLDWEKTSAQEKTEALLTGLKLTRHEPGWLKNRCNSTKPSANSFRPASPPRSRGGPAGAGPAARAASKRDGRL